MMRKVVLRLGAGIVLILAIALVTIELRWDREFAAPYPRIPASTAHDAGFPW